MSQLKSIKISLSNRERNFCEIDSHQPQANQNDLILVTKENELDEQKPLNQVKFSELVANKQAINVLCLELGGLKLTPSAIEQIGNCGLEKLECLRIYDCLNLTDEAIKLFGKYLHVFLQFQPIFSIGQRFGKTICHLEILGNNTLVTEAGLKALLGSIGNLEALHLDDAIALLANYSGTVTNMRHVWSKININQKDQLSQFTIKYAPYLRQLDITFSNTKEKTNEFIKLLENLTGVCSDDFE